MTSDTWADDSLHYYVLEMAGRDLCDMLRANLGKQIAN